MTQDIYGNEITTQKAETLAAYEVFACDLIGGGPRVRSIFAAADADSDCALVNAHAAAVLMAQEAASGFKKARVYLRRARKAIAGATEREKAFVSAVTDWWRGNTTGALKRLRKTVAAHPADIVAAKWAQYLAFALGDARALLEVAEAVLPAHRQTAAAWSMLALAQVQNGDLAAAEQAAAQAMKLEPSDPFAHQALALVFDAGQRLDEGITFLTRQAPGWADCDPAVRARNYWHLAMLHLDRGDVQRTLEIFDKRLWGERRDLASEQVGAIAVLWRLESLGADVGARWEPVVAKVIERWHEHIQPLNDLHFVYALARAGRAREVQDFLASMVRHGEKDVTGVWESVAIPCARGLVAFAERRLADSAALTEPVLKRLHLVGGSEAQRQVFATALGDGSRSVNLRAAA